VRRLVSWDIFLADASTSQDHESFEEDQEFPPELIERWRQEVKAQKENLFRALSLPPRKLNPLKKGEMSRKEMTRYLNDTFEGWKGTQKNSENVQQ